MRVEENVKDRGWDRGRDKEVRIRDKSVGINGGRISLPLRRILML